MPTAELTGGAHPSTVADLTACMVTGVVEAPNGAHFTSCVPDYDRDEAFQRGLRGGGGRPGSVGGVPAAVPGRERGGLPGGDRRAGGRGGSAMTADTTRRGAGGGRRWQARGPGRGLRRRVRGGVPRRRGDPREPLRHDPDDRRAARPAHVRAGPAADRRGGARRRRAPGRSGSAPDGDTGGGLAALPRGLRPALEREAARHDDPGQIDAFGNANISAIGDHARPKAQLLGVRGAPGNTVNHPTSYWVPRHSPRVFIRHGRHGLRGRLRQRGHGRAGRDPVPWRCGGSSPTWRPSTSTRPRTRCGCCPSTPASRVAEVVAATGFDLVIGDDVPVTREPTAEELHLIREVIDPQGARYAEVPA